MACQLAGVQGVAKPKVPEKAVVLMAADHGVARVEDISNFKTNSLVSIHSMLFVG